MCLCVLHNNGLNAQALCHALHEVVYGFATVAGFAASSEILLRRSLETLPWRMQLKDWLNLGQFRVVHFAACDGFCQIAHRFASDFFGIFVCELPVAYQPPTPR